MSNSLCILCTFGEPRVDALHINLYFVFLSFWEVIAKLLEIFAIALAALIGGDDQKLGAFFSTLSRKTNHYRHVAGILSQILNPEL